MAQKSLALPVFLIAIGYLVFAGLAGWWPWNVQVVLNPNVSLSPTPFVVPEPTLAPFVILADQYTLQCNDDDGNIFEGEPWYEYLKSRILPGWSMTTVCHNAELNRSIYFRVNFNPDDYPSNKKDKYSQFGIYDISKDDFVVGPKKALDTYEGCGEAVVWMRTNRIHYNCEQGDGGYAKTETYSFDLETQIQTLIRRCASETGYEGNEKETCVNNPKN